MKKSILFIASLLLCITNFSAQSLKAGFTAKESNKEIYRQGFDSAEELQKWTLESTNQANTWHLTEKPRVNGIPSFSTINPNSKFSLAIWYDSKTKQDEILTSEEIQIPEGAKCSFFACFDGVFVLYANLILSINDGVKEEELFNAFKWSQESGHERAKWVPCQVDLAKYANKKVKFSFKYQGLEGDDALIDDFIITQPDLSGNSSVGITEGEQVHFEDLSTGNPTSWKWSFEGGTPASSTERNPIVTYQKSGTYPVKLEVSNSTGNDVSERAGFVTVRSIAPTAIVGFPKEGYLSPWVACYVPLDTEVHFTDQSKGQPTAWAWQLQGSNKEQSNEQNPVVSYPKEGLYSLSLTVSNMAGTHSEIYQQALQAGGKQYIWNIEMSENAELAPIDLGFYGYYGGTNWLDMRSFAEHFDKPAQPGSISEVAVYFASTETVSPDALITVSIARAKNGLPDETLASTGIRAADLSYSETDFAATVFTFDKPVEVNDEFFIVISGFPNNSTETEADNISLFCSPRRKDGGKTTVYHELAELDESYEPNGQYKWYKSEDEFISFAVTPLFSYNTTPSSIVEQRAPQSNNAYVANDMLYPNAGENIETIAIYKASGEKVYASTHPTSSISVKEWESGIYILITTVKGKQTVQKIKI